MQRLMAFFVLADHSLSALGVAATNTVVYFVYTVLADREKLPPTPRGLEPRPPPFHRPQGDHEGGLSRLEPTLAKRNDHAQRDTNC